MAKRAAVTTSQSATTVSKGQNNRQRIVAAALHLFTERGYAETSIGDVAEHAGLLKGNLSYYFKTKADLLAPVCDARQQELFDRLQKRLPIDATPTQALEAFIDVTEDAASEHLLRGGVGRDNAGFSTQFSRHVAENHALLHAHVVNGGTGKLDGLERIVETEFAAQIQHHVFGDHARAECPTPFHPYRGGHG